MKGNKQKKRKEKKRKEKKRKDKKRKEKKRKERIHSQTMLLKGINALICILTPSIREGPKDFIVSFCWF